MTELLDEPVAAIRIGSHGVDKIRLENAGSKPLTMDLDSATAVLELWRDRRVASHSSSGPLGGCRVEAAPGWTLEIDVPGIDSEDAGRLTARVELVADNEGVFVPMSVSPAPRDL